MVIQGDRKERKPPMDWGSSGCIALERFLFVHNSGVQAHVVSKNASDEFASKFICVARMLFPK